ncbi:MAG: hypothetical protein F6K39_47275 [Okeania sp. SIO3B3]|nr:hypothetical protein [Okeania sp. SIO3B3]
MEQGEIKAGLERYHTEIIHSRRRLGYRGGLLSSLSALLMGQVYTGDYIAAKTTYQEVLDLQQRSGDIYHLPVIKYYHGLSF